MGISNPAFDEESIISKEMEEFFHKTIQRDNTGRYQVSLPFNENVGTLGDNEKISRCRLNKFLTTTKRTIIDAADRELQRCLKKGFIERARPTKTGELAHYLPIQAVVKKASVNEEIKIRVVKDASARGKNFSSLNDALLTGDNLLPSVLSILLRLREYPIAIMCDIENAFLQLKVNPDQRGVLRFFFH